MDEEITLGRSSLGQLGREGLRSRGGDNRRLSSRSGKAADSRVCLGELSNPERRPLDSWYHLTLRWIYLFESSICEPKVRRLVAKLDVPNPLISCTLPQILPRGAHLGGGPPATVAETRCTPFFA